MIKKVHYPNIIKKELVYFYSDPKFNILFYPTKNLNVYTGQKLRLYLSLRNDSTNDENYFPIN